MSAATLQEQTGRPVHHVRTRCRACGGSSLVRFLSLGLQPLANANLRDPAEARDELRFPLDLYFCEGCSLVQLVDVIDPEVLFRHYIYVTGTSETIAAHNRDYARTVVDLLNLGPDDLVVEAASNDGSLLSCFRDIGVRTLGVEPAINIAAVAQEKGVETVTEFFGEQTGAELRRSRGRARAVLGNNVLAHVDDTVGFLRGARSLIDEEGLVIVEVPHALPMLEKLEYDTVYHEHLCYFSLTALIRLFEAAGLRVVRVDRQAVHGGTIRVYGALPSSGRRAGAEVVAMIAEEQAAGLTSLDRWHRFARDVEAQRAALLALLAELRAAGKSIAGYGAPAKGNTLLNYCGIGTDLVPYTVDRNPLKVGTWTPGTHLPVLPADTLVERQPDYVLILAWNFADEIMRQQRAYQSAGGRFIIPIPSPVVL
ncbi:MAG TPA: class I SAM-dependent methyltransferase [Gemmatimonadales bacterium]|jgi:hypothetical protein